MAPRDRNHGRRLRRRAFTLMESLMASGLLLVIVIAVTSAITAGQQHAFEAQQRIAATLAAEDVMGRVLTEPYHRLDAWDDWQEPPGSMTALSGTRLPQTFATIGRKVTVGTDLQRIDRLGVTVRGRSIAVTAYTEEGRVLANLERFVPEPPS